MSKTSKERAALAALDFVEDGMTLGLGTGSTAAFFISALGEKVRAGLDVVGIPTSEASAKAAADAGIELIVPNETTQIDLAVDGADEVDASGHLIKGGGAALLREKIIAHAAKDFVVIADDTKKVTELGAFPLPIEIEPFGFALTIRALRELLQSEGYEQPDLSLRSAVGNGFVLTDGGNYVADVRLGRIKDPVRLEKQLDLIPGVVESGLFVGMANKVILGTTASVETLNF